MNEIFIYNAIGENGTTGKDLTEKLNLLKGQDVKVRINSPGGSVFEGNAIYNAIKEHGQCDVYIDGVAASMASIIMLAGRKIVASQNALIMIHNPSIAEFDGDSKKLKALSQLLDKIKASALENYAKRTGISEEELSTMLDNETWLTAQEALEKSFIDEITGGVLENSPIVIQRANSLNTVFLSYKKKNEAPEPISLINELRVVLDMKEKGFDLVTAKVKEILLLNKEYESRIESIKQEQKEEAIILVDYAISKQYIENRYRDFHLDLFTKDFKQARVDFVSGFKKKLNLAEMVAEATINRVSKGKESWNLDDYRRLAPSELEKSPELFNRLLKERENGKL